jgi:hypothetical protein
MKAKRIFYDKQRLPDGAVIEMLIWQLPKADEERKHGLKYSLFYGKDGNRLIGYDNEKGKGDHRHYGENEESYIFETLEKLVSDFIDDVNELRGEL